MALIKGKGYKNPSWTYEKDSLYATIVQNGL